MLNDFLSADRAACGIIWQNMMEPDWPQMTIQGVHKRMVRFQKLTRNLFLTLHGHNAHRQQQQLSEFLMHYQQFASHAYCGASFQDGVAAGKGCPDL